MQILEREKELKANAKKGKKYQEEYEEFLSKKEEKIRKIYSKKSQLNFTKPKREAKEAPDTDIKEVDSKRLQSYGI